LILILDIELFQILGGTWRSQYRSSASKQEV